MPIIFVAGTASMVFHAPPVIMWIVRNLIAWPPSLTCGQASIAMIAGEVMDRTPEMLKKQNLLKLL